MKKIAALILVFLTLSSLVATARGRLKGETNYNIPMNSESVDESLGFGLSYRFWGVFVATGSVYTDIVYGGRWLIQSIVPIGLGSFGMGMEIPMGGFYLSMDWQKFYTRTAPLEGIYAFSDSFKIGMIMELSRWWSLEVYNRKLYNFSPESELSAENINLFGIAVAVSR
jgi:hypothetical protein